MTPESAWRCAMHAYRDAVRERLDLSPAAKLIADRILDRMGASSTSWPSLRGLTESCGLRSASTVATALGALHAAGVVAVTWVAVGASRRATFDLPAGILRAVDQLASTLPYDPGERSEFRSALHKERSEFQSASIHKRSEIRSAIGGRRVSGERQMAQRSEIRSAPNCAALRNLRESAPNFGAEPLRTTIPTRPQGGVGSVDVPAPSELIKGEPGIPGADLGSVREGEENPDNPETLPIDDRYPADWPETATQPLPEDADDPEPAEPPEYEDPNAPDPPDLTDWGTPEEIAACDARRAKWHELAREDAARLAGGQAKPMTGATMPASLAGVAQGERSGQDCGQGPETALRLNTGPENAKQAMSVAELEAGPRAAGLGVLEWSPAVARTMASVGIPEGEATSLRRLYGLPLVIEAMGEMRDAQELGQKVKRPGVWVANYCRYQRGLG